MHQSVPSSMTEFITIGKGKDRRRVPVSPEQPRPRLGKSTDHKEKWSARDYLMDKYGKEAFNEDGTIKLSYVDRAIDEAERDHRNTIKRKLERVRTLKTMRHDPKGNEVHVKAHESHSRDGKVEEVRGHEMHLPSYEGGASTKLTMEDRHKLPASAFAEPGRRAYPIPSARQLEESLGWSREKARKGAERHAINALARVEQHGTPEEKRAIRRKIHENVPEVDGAVMKHGFTPTEMTVVHVKGYEQPRYYVPPHESHSKDGKVEHVEGHYVEAHEVEGYEEEMNRKK